MQELHMAHELSQIQLNRVQIPVHLHALSALFYCPIFRHGANLVKAQTYFESLLEQAQQKATPWGPRQTQLKTLLMLLCLNTLWKSGATR